MDEDGISPILDVRANVDWLTLNTRTFYYCFPRLYNGILDDVFTQKASMGWHPASRHGMSSKKKRYIEGWKQTAALDTFFLCVV